jgi:hypothetical protein
VGETYDEVRLDLAVVGLDDGYAEDLSSRLRLRRSRTVPVFDAAGEAGESAAPCASASPPPM